MSLGGFNISDKLLHWMQANLSGTLLELGSGEGTKYLVEHFDKVYSVEDQEDYQNLYHDNYINVEIEDNWYNVEHLKEGLKGLSYDAILVDGPTGSGRRIGFYYSLALFNLNVPIIIDDTHRDVEMAMFRKLSYKLKGKKQIHIRTEDKKASILW